MTEPLPEDVCRWHDCSAPATIKIVRINENFCEEHYLLNVLRFGCEFETKPIRAIQRGDDQ